MEARNDGIIRNIKERRFKSQVKDAKRDYSIVQVIEKCMGGTLLFRHRLLKENEDICPEITSEINIKILFAPELLAL